MSLHARPRMQKRREAHQSTASIHAFPMITSWAVKTESSHPFIILYSFMRHEQFWLENPLSPCHCCLRTPRPLQFKTLPAAMSQQQKLVRVSVFTTLYRAESSCPRLTWSFTSEPRRFILGVFSLSSQLYI